MTIQAIPLSKLVPSVANVRRANPTERVEELAASIAAHGLLQNLTVRNAARDRFEVVAGGRRLAALKLLAKQKLWGKNELVPCQVIDGDNLTEISLAENALQCPMHPADQYEAFARLHGEGMGLEDIAARFGVSAKTVMQRLRLGGVSPALLALYRDGAMKLDQLTAFAITDDHPLQERVWNELGHYNRTRNAILHALNEGQVPSDDRRARYIGVEAYTVAGGTITHDLFDEEGGGFFADGVLLNRLVAEKLAKEAEAVTAEGWKWVETLPAYDYGAVSALRRIYPQARALTDDEEQQLEQLTLRSEALSDDADAYEPDELNRMFEEIETAIEAIRGESGFSEGDKARAGVFVTLGGDGHSRIERGFVRREDEAAPTGDEEAEAGHPAEGGLSAKLTTELTAHRTAALANELAQKPETALAALLHALASRLFYRDLRASCLDITPRRITIASHAADIAESRALLQIDERHAAWERRMPEEPEGLWSFIITLTEVERLGLLAHCTSLTLDAVHLPGKTTGDADRLASALALDMATYWQPTAKGFFARVPKATVVKAVEDGYCAEGAQTLTGLKKLAMAERAEKLLAGKGWLPDLLRTVAL